MRSNRYINGAAALLACVAMAALAMAAPPVPDYHQFTGGFVSAKGERALAMGYPAGLEVWAYPLQLVSDLQLRFTEAGVVGSIPAAPLLRDVERTPTEVIRTYDGPDFQVREHIFVPRRAAGAVITYEVAGRNPVSIEASFRPSLDLMWPGALGGQEIAWNPSRSGYVETEPLHHFSATIASSQAVAHDDIVNRNRPIMDRVAMVLKPVADASGVRTAVLVLALDPETATDGAAAILAGARAAKQDAEDHAAAVLQDSLRIETPDPAVDTALQSATLALDQAWACNDRIGCGELAGFGPSRGPRRPQYAWFFAGDGLVATRAMIDVGQFDRARQEIAFITRYQDPASGMIWHEMSQSAGLIDWARYGHMYVHVDISFQYVATVAAYLKATGDTAFVRSHWPAIDKAWRYCRSTIDAGNGLPRIPAGKQAQDEQHALRDDIRLSSAWVDAADGMSALARATGHKAMGDTAAQDAVRARAAIARLDWDAASGFWLEGHTVSGEPVASQRSDAIGIVDQAIFDTQQTDMLLKKLASADFVTDWGLRSMSARDPDYNPDAYALGSVWALGTSSAALAFWHHGRADLAWRLWRGLVDWNTLDSAGHLHEVLAGDLYHPNIESVPEQTWSSAGLLGAAVHGLFGLEIDAARRSIVVAPHLPRAWRHMALRNVAVGTSKLDLIVERNDAGVFLTIDNPGPPVTVRFDPGPSRLTKDGVVMAGTGATRIE